MGLHALTTGSAVLLVALSGVAAAGAAEPEAFQAMKVIPAAPPVAAPAFRFRDLEGQPVILDAFRGRAVLLTFFTTW